MPAHTPSARPVSDDGASVDRAISHSRTVFLFPDFELSFPESREIAILRKSASKSVKFFSILSTFEQQISFRGGSNVVKADKFWIELRFGLRMFSIILLRVCHPCITFFNRSHMCSFTDMAVLIVSYIPLELSFSRFEEGNGVEHVCHNLRLRFISTLLNRLSWCL